MKTITSRSNRPISTIIDEKRRDLAAIAATRTLPR
jgi:hypothetical protein